MKSSINALVAIVAITVATVLARPLLAEENERGASNTGETVDDPWVFLREAESALSRSPEEAITYLIPDLRDPANHDPAYQCRLSATALAAFGYVLRRDTAPSDLMDLIEDRRRVVETVCLSEPGYLVQAGNRLAGIYLSADRPAEALRVAEWVATNTKGYDSHPFERPETLDLIATSYAFLGLLERSREYGKKSWEAARDVLARTRKAASSSQALSAAHQTYFRFALREMGRAAHGDRPEIVRTIWQELRDILLAAESGDPAGRQWFEIAVAAMEAAALSGEDETYTATAQAIFQQRPRETAFVADQVEQFDIHDQSAINQMERERLAKLQLYYERRYALPEAIRAGAEGRLRDAADHHLRYLAIGTKLGSRPSLGEYLRAAKAQNAAGRFVDAERLYGEANGRFEMQRVNVPLASRWTVARGDKIEAYRGQVYAAAKIYERDPTSKNLDRLLVSDSHLRSRQIADLRGVDPANVSGSAIRRVLAENEAWLQFSITESAVVVIALTRKDTVVRVVPAEESAIDTTVRRIARTLQVPGELDLESSSELTELADMLFSGLTEILNTNNRLTVLPSGVLATIPIEVLTHAGGPLGLSHQISYSTSPAIAVHMRGKRRKLRTGGFLGVADPDYRQIEVERHSPSMPTAIGRPRGIERFVPLPETRREVETAARSIGQKAEFLFGAEASEPALRAQGLATRRYLHFATHGVLGSQIPEVREPALALSQSADSSADHFLTFTEILDFELSADLTVLSACNTGSGEWFAGEGTMGLGRAFLAAGSDAVVMSLWEVDSHATVELMEHFYSALAEGKSNEEALLDARRKVAGLSPIKSKKAEARGIRTNLPVATSYRHPYYWSPFVLLRN